MTDELDTAGNPDAGASAQQDDTKAAATDTTATETKTEDKAPAADKTKEAGDTKPADDWRVKLANGDEKELKRLSRFASEADVYKAYRELEKKRDSGELVQKRPFPKDGKPEEIAAWRKENGVPEAPDGYDLKFDNGLVIGEEDKPLIDKFIQSMHGENASPSQVKAAISSYYSLVAEQQAARAEADAAFKDSALDELREEWGGDFKKNVNIVSNFLSNAPDGVREMFESGRTADGQVIGNHPQVLRWIAQLAYEANPVASVMPNAGGNQIGSLNDEIASIEKMIGDRSSDYWSGPKAEKTQARYNELLSAREKIAARS